MSRLRAARVIVNVKLALGEFTLDQAAEYLAPMDARTAHREASEFSVNPGQAMTYQVGKLQIEKLLAETRLRQGKTFSLRSFNDVLVEWKRAPGTSTVGKAGPRRRGAHARCRRPLASALLQVRCCHWGRRLAYSTSTSPTEKAPWTAGIPADTTSAAPPLPA